MSNIAVRSAGVLVAFLMACGGSETLEPPDGTMRVRLVNALNSTSELRLVAKGAQVLGDVGPGTASPFVDVPVSATELLIQRELGDGSITVPIVAVEDGMFAATVMGDNNVLYATVATVSQADTGRAVAGRANLRAINLAGGGNAPEIDIHVTAPGASLVGATPAWQMAAMLNLYTGLKDFAPGQLQVRVTLRGESDVIAQSAVLDVAADQIRVITLRHTGNNQFEVVIAVEQGQ